MVFKHAWELRDKDQISTENRVFFLENEWNGLEKHEIVLGKEK